MGQNSRCSTWFHLLVPGGKWLTAIDQPLSSAHSCSATFHSRLRQLLLPPPSAVISTPPACGNAPAPHAGHQRRSAATANRAVLWSIPTLTQPRLRSTS